MKNNIFTLAVGAVLSFILAGCTPETSSLGTKDYASADLVEGLAFTITKDASNPNIVTFTSLLDDSYHVYWITPQGRAQGSPYTINIAFDGTYAVQMGIDTRGGVVFGPEQKFTIDDFCADFVTDEMWTLLTGGVGSSKKWFLDLDENGVSRYFAGPMFFKGTDDCWESVTLGQTIDGDSWSWDANWSSIAGWGFTTTAQDFGYMEFSLSGGANVHTVQNDLGRDQSGTFLLDTDNHTIKFSDAELLHESVYDKAVDNWQGQSEWGNVFRLLSLTKDAMQIGVIRNSDACILCYNYISEDYFNNWTEGGTVEEVITPSLQDDWRDYVEPKTQYIMSYKMSEDEPYDWCSLDGKAKGISVTPVSGVEDIAFEMNHNKNTYKFTDIDGNTYEGTYTLSDDGIFTFSGVIPGISLSDVDNATLFEGTTLRVLSISTSAATGALEELWLGKEIYDDQGSLYEYLGYHFILQTGGESIKSYKAVLSFFDTGWGFQYSDEVAITGDGSYTFTINGSSSDTYGLFLDVYKVLKDNPNFNMTVTDIKIDGSSIEFDDTIIDRGIGDDATTARRYIVNPWGATAGTASSFNFTSTLSVTIKVEMDCGEVVMK